MKRIIIGIITINSLIAHSWAYATEHGVKLEQTPETPSMLTEIRAVMDTTRIAEQALRTEFGQGQDTELTRRLGDLKKASRMRILHIQLKYAREEGRTELERRILASIEDLQRPAAPGGPRLTGRVSPLPEAQAAVSSAGGSQR